jgi:hypothetical protein
LTKPIGDLEGDLIKQGILGIPHQHVSPPFQNIQRPFLLPPRPVAFETKLFWMIGRVGFQDQIKLRFAPLQQTRMPGVKVTLDRRYPPQLLKYRVL